MDLDIYSEDQLTIRVGDLSHFEIQELTNTRILNPESRDETELGQSKTNHRDRVSNGIPATESAGKRSASDMSQPGPTKGNDCGTLHDAPLIS